MNRFKFFNSMVFAALALLGTASTMTHAQSNEGVQQSVRLGTSSAGSTFYAIAVGISELWRKHSGINATVEPLGGSAATINALSAGKLDVAMSNSGSAWPAYHGQKPFKQAADIALIAQGQPSLRYLVVRRDAEIKSPSDLAGKRFLAKRRALPEIELIADALLQTTALAKDKVKIIETVETNQAIAALKAGTADAAIFPGGLRIPSLQEMLRDKVVDLMPMSADKADAMMQKLPNYFSKVNLPAGTFENQANASVAPTLNTYLVARRDMSEDTAYKMTKAIFANQKEFFSYHAEAKHWTLENTLDDFKIPFHPGAIRYFKEVGAWNAKLEAAQAAVTRK
jgi:TRAP transporter TAXI family solute receptor